jgi:hypothetical protein
MNLVTNPNPIYNHYIYMTIPCVTSDRRRAKRHHIKRSIMKARDLFSIKKEA